ncbi:PQQ-binding-like beta-propeller repeat protein [Saccharicrinis sp. 156]|uniref:outer membrane protein assembly factor BamB family protein n=1 Tax=Saccharicrinis sp. 156 TaxID=3417574 RepID=UPI003D3268F8
MNRFICIGLILITCIACERHSEDSGSVDDHNWKLFRGNTRLNGYVEKYLPEEPVLLWTFKGGKRTVSSPVIDNGTTYWCDRKGLINGVDINGKLSFSYNLNTSVEATPMIHDSILYIGRIDGYLTALSLANKDTVWNYETLGQISASPNIAQLKNGANILFGSYDNYFYCLNHENGQLVNKFESGYYINGAAALKGNHVLFGGCDAWLRIINYRTGIPTDSLLLDAYLPSSPAIMGKYCYIGDYTGNVYEILLSKGKIAGSKKIREPESDNESFVSIPAVSCKSVYIYAGDRHLLSIDRETGKTNFKYMLKGDVGDSAPVVSRNKLIVCTKDGIVSILDNKTGELLWEYDTGEQIVASPAVISDHFMILTTKGTLFCFGKKTDRT